MRRIWRISGNPAACTALMATRPARKLFLDFVDPVARFTGFHLNIHTDGMDMSPIYTFGKCEPCAGQLRLPLCAQLHHAVCDGFHAARLFNEVQALCDEEAWLDE